MKIQAKKTEFDDISDTTILGYTLMLDFNTEIVNFFTETVDLFYWENVDLFTQIVDLFLQVLPTGLLCQTNNGLKSCNEIMEMDHPPTHIMQIFLSPGQETENLFGVAL